MSNGLLYIAGLVALALAALFAVPYFIDWNGYRGVFEEEATRILGREVRVGGNVNVRFLPSPFVRFDKLRIADTSTTTGEPFFRAESFTMRLSVPPLLKGIIEANEISLKRPVLRLAVDADGGGNWRSLSIAPGTLPFVPSDVTLQSVKIEDGVVALQGPKGIGFAELKGLNGELKAESIDGPFSFKGTASWQGADQELRFATSPIDPDGSVRFKATVRGAENGNSYAVDGRVTDFKGHPRIDGDVTAKLALDGTQLPNAGGESPLVDFKAQLSGDAMGLKLDDINVSFERIGQPQLITGTASVSWEKALDLDLQLDSRWLDLDRIAATANDESPFDTARSFVLAFMQSLPEKAETKVRFDLDQANLGGEAVSDVRIGVARTNGVLLLDELRAGLPGGAKLAVDGTVAQSANTKFQGEFALRGTSLARFLNWAVKDPSMTDMVRSDGPFSLQGQLAMSDKGIDLTEAGAEIAGMPLSGEVHYASGKRTRLAIALEGQQIDGSLLWPTGVDYLKGMLTGADSAKDNSDAPKPKRWLDTATSDLSLRLRAAELQTGTEPLRDVDLDVAIENGRMTMRTCKFKAADGLAFDLEGDVADTDGDPRGDLRFVLAAPREDAFSSFVKLWGLSDSAAQQTLRYSALAPMRLAGSIRLGERAKGTADIFADGSVEGGRTVATARLDGGLDDWRNAGADLALTIQSKDVVHTFDKLSARASSAPAGERQHPGEIFFKAVGTPAKGMLAAATVKASGLFFAYDGRIELPAENKRKFDGELRVSASELGDVMALAGLGNGGSLRGVPVVGTAKMTSADHAIELKPQQLSVGGSKVGGTLALAYPKGGPAIVTAQLQVDQATIPSLLGVALDRSSTAAVEAAEPLTQGKSIWPESSFDFAALDGMEAKVGVRFGTLSLEPGMDIEQAQLDVELAPGQITVTRLEGKALDGGVSAALALKRIPGGASVAGEMHLTDVHLQGGSDESAKPGQGGGTASVALDFYSRGATPGGLIAVATGKGEITLGDMSMRVPTPLAVIATSEAVLNGTAGGNGDALIAALREQMGSSKVKVGPRKIAIAIADGAAKLDPFTLPSPAGETKVETTVDLASLLVDSTWVLEPKAPDIVQPDKPRKGALPPVNVVYVGPLKDAWTLEPRITADQLERELAIRKMELDAAQLEHLHKLDAERARQDAERRKAIDAERADHQEAPVDLPPGAANSNPASPQSAAQPQMVPLPPLEDRGTAAKVPLPPGQASATLPLDAVDPAFNAPVAVSPDQGAAGAAGIEPAPPQTTPRPRRAVRRQVPAGEQVLRALQGF